MKEEILSGLKIALERGSSLEKAMQSFINAGYNPSDVREAGEYIGSGSILTSPQSNQQNLSQTSNQIPKNYPINIQSPNNYSLPSPTPNTLLPSEKKDSRKLLIIFAIILFIIALILISLIIFKDKLFG